jgi:hypothetical protein
VSYLKDKVLIALFIFCVVAVKKAYGWVVQFFGGVDGMTQLGDVADSWHVNSLLKV